MAVTDATVNVSATASDNWGPVALTWNFGDGAIARANSAAHVYRSAGTHTLTITATDASGNATSQTRTITVDRSAPIFTARPWVLNRRFRVSAKRTTSAGHAAAGRKHFKTGTVFTFALNRAASVKLTIRGIRRSARPLTLTRSSHAGANRVRFTGQLGKRVLHPGRYRATFIARDPSSAASRPITVTFTVVAG